MEVLIALAARAGQVVGRRELEDTVWPGMLVTDDALTRCIYQLRRALESLLDEAGGGPPIETVRKRGYRLRLPIGVNGHGDDHDGGGRKRPPRESWPRFRILSRAVLLMLATILIAAVLLPSWFKRLDRAESGLSSASIAVLPFLNLTGDPELDTVADGFTEQLSHDLANVPELRVAARTSSFFFKDKSIEASEIADQMGVDLLIEGSLRQGGGATRVTVQLIDKEGFHTWSGEFDRAQRDPLRLQSEISRQVLDALGWNADRLPATLPSESIENFEAYDRYLQGRIRLSGSDADALDDAMALFREALELKPDYARAHTGLADAWSLGIWSRKFEREPAIRAADEAIGRALDLDPDLAEAYASRGLLHLCLNEYPEAEAPLRRATELNPNYLNARNWLGLSLVYQDRFSDAVQVYLGAQKLDPMDAGLNRNLGANLLLTGKPEAGFSYLRRARTIDPAAPVTYRILSGWSRLYGRLGDSVRWAVEGLEQDPGNAALLTELGASHLQIGDFDRSRELFAQAWAANPGDAGLLSNRFQLYLATNDLDSMDALLSRTDYRDGRFGQQRVLLRWEYIRMLLDNDYQRVIDSAEGRRGDDALACNVFMAPGARIYLAFAFRRAGNAEAAEAIIRECRNALQQVRNNGGDYPKLIYRSALLSMLNGDHDSAAETLARAYEAGWRGYYEAWNDPIWREVHSRDAYRNVFRRALAEVTAHAPNRPEHADESTEG